MSNVVAIERGRSFASRTQVGRADRTTHGIWLHTVSHLDPKYGGLSSVVPQLNSSIAEAGQFSLQLAGFCNKGEFFTPAIPSRVQVEHLPLSRLDWLSNSRVRMHFRELVSRARGLHIHGLWQQTSAVSGREARAMRKPYVISAHGMLESWAVANKRWKKSLYMNLVERANLEGAACLHALTQAEAGDYRRAGLKNPIAVIPNGVQIPAEISSDLFLEQFPALKDKRLVLFLGRLHFKKGLDILCQAWAEVSRRHPDAHLVLAGPDFENTQTQIQQLVTRLGLTSRVTFTGMLSGDLKWGAFAAAEAFVLPSYSEGLSVSVLEAMGVGVPVVITENCNLPEVADRSCGWVIKPDAGSLEAALRDLLRRPSASLTKMGEQGRRLVKSRYSWDVIGDQMTDIYHWILTGALPDSVDIQFAAAPRRT